ncbi:uncharacterized protein LOC129556556 [Moschus berezovskii]|uniref:uncharacterized protein LOC129556556 n=1 Tax=Moschus berezovskii TaxID=68408 RepID=UPI002443C7D9|nr:uncharacterized protein LOC129556556 [Moschus berezovskii]
MEARPKGLTQPDSDHVPAPAAPERGPKSADAGPAHSANSAETRRHAHTRQETRLRRSEPGVPKQLRPASYSQTCPDPGGSPVARAYPPRRPGRSSRGQGSGRSAGHPVSVSSARRVRPATRAPRPGAIPAPRAAPRAWAPRPAPRPAPSPAHTPHPTLAPPILQPAPASRAPPPSPSHITHPTLAPRILTRIPLPATSAHAELPHSTHASVRFSPAKLWLHVPHPPPHTSRPLP